MLQRARGWIGESMMANTWEEFADYQHQTPVGFRVAVEKTHDFMHNLTGGGVQDHPNKDKNIKGDMIYQEFTSYDPIHPWDDKTFEPFVNLYKVKLGVNDVGIDYTKGSFHFEDKKLLRSPKLKELSSIPLVHNFSINVKQLNYVVSVKNVNRTFIHGSFTILLYATFENNKELIGTEYCFQAENPLKCTRCNDKPLIDFGFHVPKKYSDWSFSIEIWSAVDGKQVALNRIGNPTFQIISTLKSL